LPAKPRARKPRAGKERDFMGKGFMGKGYFGLVRATLELVWVLTELVTVPRFLCAMAGVAKAKAKRRIIHFI